jgi:plastocyanin
MTGQGELPMRTIAAATLCVVTLFGATVVVVTSSAAEPGAVAGTVRLAGQAPPVRLLQPRVDPAVCGSEPRPSEALVVSASGGVKNAVVFIGHERMEGWRSPTTFQIDQRGCAFVPHVPIIPPGSTVEILNSDGILHNFHTVSRLNPPMNLAQPGKAKPLRVTFERPEVVPVKCDLHGEGFMRAWIVVAAHPYYALTDDEGRFRLADVPPGPHTLEVWHETLGTRRVPVTVGASGEVTVTVTLKSVAP